MLPEPDPDETGPCAHLGFATAKPGYAERVEELILGLVEPLRAEPGAVEFHAHRDRADTSQFVIYEVFWSKADLERHLAQPYVQESFRRLSQLSLGYRPSAINVNELLYSLKGPLAGQRAPDAGINAREQIFDLLQGYQLHVVALSRKHLTAAEVTEHAKALDALGVAAHLVARVEARPDERVHQADSAQVFEHYGLTEPDSQALYVIRPDGHIAWRMDELDIEACQRFLGTLHSPTTEEEALAA
ncbi:putative quinol monooxygenase [Allokutzneria sp. NRRL B-24872]|uniref:putative quinol monooxygenase n=1 Tax=Allokutzneria sp. NRRL B-24872 TaxID=1137961 RepID=UPI000A3BF8B7|nr:putative quinol monooxygenase [Allokutzneria sp. NRRL B-24872]